MKPIATPAYRPTADSIWNSFLISGKRHLLITGGRGAGKTTLFDALRPAGAPTVRTRAIPQREVRLIEEAARKETVVGVFDPALPGPENRMRPCPGAFDGAGVQALDRCLRAPGEWAALDEIGYLECASAAYTDALLRLMDGKRVIAVLRRQELPFLSALRARGDAFCIDLDAPYGRMGCVIMASGMGNRFGGNKLMEDFCGGPLFLRALAATDGLFARRVVVTRHDEVARLARARGAETVLHDQPLRSDTVRIGLEAVGDVSGCLFCPADQPLLRRETVASLVLAAANGPADIYRPCHLGEPGSPVLFPAWAFDELRALPAGKGGGFVISNHPDRVRLLPVGNALELADADTPAMLDALRRAEQPT